MDKLILNLTGGYPLELDDLIFQFGAYDSAFKALCDGFDKAFILTGCEVTALGAGLYDIEPGAVVLNGEIWLYPGVSSLAITDLTDCWFVPDISFDAAGNEVFEDLGSNNTYQKRRAVMVETDPAPVGDKVAIQGHRLSDVMWSMLRTSRTEFIDAPLSNGWVDAGPPYQRSEYRSEPGGIVRLRGLVNGQSASSNVVMQLPVGYRPQGTLRCNLGSVTDATRHRVAQIDTNGFVSIVIVGGYDIDDQYDLSNLPTFVVA